MTDRNQAAYQDPNLSNVQLFAEVASVMSKNASMGPRACCRFHLNAEVDNNQWTLNFIELNGVVWPVQNPHDTRIENFRSVGIFRINHFKICSVQISCMLLIHAKVHTQSAISLMQPR